MILENLMEHILLLVFAKENSFYNLAEILLFSLWSGSLLMRLEWILDIYEGFGLIRISSSIIARSIPIV